MGGFSFYLPGLFLFPFFDNYFSLHYNFEGTPYVAFLIMASFFSMSYFIIYILASKVNIKPKRYLSSTIVNHVFFVLALLFLFSAVHFSLNYSAAFRHVNRLNDSSIWVTFLFALYPLLSIFSLFALIHTLNGNQLGQRSKLVLLMFFIGILISLNSALQSITMMILFLILVRPKFFSTSLNSIPITRLALACCWYDHLYCCCPCGGWARKQDGL